MRYFAPLLFACSLALTGCGVNFQEFSPPDGSFTVKMPGTPKKTSSGGLSGHVWETLTQRWNFAVGLIDLPPEALSIVQSQPTAGLDGGVQGMVSQLKATTKGTSSVTLNGYPGREVELSLPAGPHPQTGKQEPSSSAVIRIFLVDNRFVMLMARCRGTITKDSAEVKTFFESFKLNGVSGAGTSMAGSPMAPPPGMTTGFNSASAPGMPAGTPLPGGASSTVPLPDVPLANGAATTPPATATLPPPMPLPTALPMPTPTTSLPGAGLPTTPPVVADAANALPQSGFKSGFSPPPEEMPAASSQTTTSLPNSTPAALPSSKPSGFTQSSGFKANENNSDTASNSSKRGKGFTSSNDAASPPSKGFGNRSSSPPKASVSRTSSNTKVSLGAINIDSASVDELLQIAARKADHRRVLAAEKLGNHRDAGPNPDVAKAMIELLHTDQITVRNAIAQSLPKWACPEIHEDVLKNMKGGTTEVRQAMIRIAAAEKIDGANEAIARCLADDEDRKVASETLISIGSDAESAVISMLNERDSKTRNAILEVLKEIGSQASIDAITKASERWSGSERQEARRALRALEAKN